MQLRTARLCLDCNEVHDAQQCPVCASDTFAYLTRWVPEADRQPTPPRPASSPEAEVYRELLHPGRPRDGGRRLKQGLLGLTALGLAGYFIKNRPRGTGDPLSVTRADDGDVVDTPTVPQAGDGSVS